MPSKKPYIQIRTDEETIKKFLQIAEEECRSMSNLGEYIVKKYIEQYEAEQERKTNKSNLLEKSSTSRTG